MPIRDLNGIYFDDNNLPVHQDGGGDTPERLGFYHTFLECRKRFGISNLDYRYTTWVDFNEAIDKIWNGKDLIRNPTPPYNQPHNNPFVPGRDQEKPLVIAAGFLFRASFLYQVNAAHEQRIFWSYQNSDLGSPEDRNTLRRGLGETPSWLGDQQLCLTSRIRCMTKDPNDVGDDLNHILTLLQTHFFQPNSRTEWATKYYFENRPSNYGNTRLGEKHPVMGAIAWYFRKEIGAPYGMVELCRPVIEHFI